MDEAAGDLRLSGRAAGGHAAGKRGDVARDRPREPAPAAPLLTAFGAGARRPPLRALAAAAIATLLSRGATRAADPAPFSIAFTGDTVLTRPLSENPDTATAALLDLVRGADAAVTNLETLFHDYRSPAMPVFPALRSDPRLARDLARAGFDLVGRANNHALDYGPEGLGETTKHLRTAGLLDAGAGESLAEARRPAYFRAPRGTVALVAATSTHSDEARAGNPRGRIPARPGVSPLRFETTAIVSREDLEAVRRIGRALGENPAAEGDSVDLGGRRYAAGEKPGLAREPNAEDVEAIAGEVKRAAGSGARPIVSVHVHEDDGGDRERPPDFVRAFARAMIDAGADAVFSHGAHVLRGIELYRGRPILYGLGNFVFEYESVDALPADDYEAVGLPPTATPADFFDRYDQRGARGYPADPEVWESVIAIARYSGKTLAAVEIYPITLGYGLPRGQRGCPRLADAESSRRILERVARLSEPFGTRIEISGAAGRVVLPAGP